ncbi:TPA: ShlB/FhaC/HecB family hemolysin secretion/activation protein [Morganella morganii]|nr:ShlB/FhaC/HecB family hemolysin secretion/activation protein [Morganella morganii]
MIKKTIAAVAMAACGCAWGSTYTSSAVSPASCAILSKVVIEQRELIGPAYLADEFEKKVAGHCLTSEQMAEAVIELESAVHEAGFITAQISVPPQNVSDGTLTLHYQPGYLSGYRDKESGDTRFGLNLIFPQRSDGQLDIRQTELGMTHLNQLPGLEAQAAVEPDPLNPGNSVITITQQKKRSISGSLEVNNHGSRSTGNRQISNRLSIENPLQLYDRLFIYTQRDMDRDHSAGVKLIYGQYRIPFRHWEFTAGGSYIEQKQQYPVYRGSLDYFTRSKTLDLNLGRKLLLTPVHDVTLSSGISAVTRRVTLGHSPLILPERRSVYWNTGLSHRWHHPAFTLQYQVQYKHSLNSFGAMPVTEKKLKHTRQLMAETTLTVPFRLAGLPFYYENVMRGSVNADKADEMDYESLSGRYSVRGYPFSHSMSAARVFISRNEVVWQQVLPGHNLYLAADAALPGMKIAGGGRSHGLAGTEIGIRGAYKSLGYQVFAGMPLKEAEGVRAFSPVGGISVSVSY